MVLALSSRGVGEPPKTVVASDHNGLPRDDDGLSVDPPTTVDAFSQDVD